MIYWLLNGEPTIVDETKENWRNLYTKLSGEPFNGWKPVVNEEEKEDSSDASYLESIQNKYVELYWKQLSPAYKNNIVWIEEKINAFTPSE